MQKVDVLTVVRPVREAHRHFCQLFPPLSGHVKSHKAAGVVWHGHNVASVRRPAWREQAFRVGQGRDLMSVQIEHLNRALRVCRRPAKRNLVPIRRPRRIPFLARISRDRLLRSPAIRGNGIHLGPLAGRETKKYNLFSVWRPFRKRWPKAWDRKLELLASVQFALPQNAIRIGNVRSPLSVSRKLHLCRNTGQKRGKLSGFWVVTRQLSSSQSCNDK